LSKFECSQMPHPVCPLLHLPVFCIWRTLTVIFIFFAQLLDHITFVDTPGVLSGEKQRTQRSYDFTGVTSWFAAKCDLILLLFDPHKLDISDEFKRVIGSLRGHDDKIRIVLNKADQVDAQQVNEPAYCMPSSSPQYLSIFCYSWKTWEYPCLKFTYPKWQNN
jgi:EH domain-containing protein 1